MADPRKVVDFSEINAKRATYKIDNSTITYDGTKANGSAQVDKAVTLSADGTVALTADGDHVEGQLISVEDDNFCTVQYTGFVKLPGGASATLTRGLKIVGALGASSAKGYIRVVASGTAAEINKGRGRIVDSSDATKVVVDLD